jgi:histone-lysine N-methyltransferase SETMAR
MTMLFETDNGADQGKHQNLLQKKSALQKINVLCLVGYGRDYYELLGPNKIINSEDYCQKLDRVNECLKEKRPHLVNRKVVFHQDNARPHVSKMTHQKIEELNWEIFDHPPYSPDLAPSDYHLFRSLQNHLNNKKSERSEEVNDAVLAYFESTPRSFYKAGTKKLATRWETVIASNGNYIID